MGLRQRRTHADDSNVPLCPGSIARREHNAERPSGARHRLLWLTALVVAALLLCAASAGAEVRTVGSVQVGVQPRSTSLFEAGAESGGSLKAVDAEGADQFSNPQGRPVVSSAKVYAIYWDPDDEYHGNWQQLINGFFASMSGAGGALDNAFAVDTQYGDVAGQHATSHTIFAGAYTDTDPYPAPYSPLPGCDPAPLTIGEITCLSGEQVEAELKTFIADHSLPKGMDAIYYLLTPPGVTDCLAAGAGKYDCSDYEGSPGSGNESYERSFCSYHAAINPGSNPEGSGETVLYAAIPWTAGGLGDLHLYPRTEAPECQDGGWEPATAGGSKKAAEKPEPEPVEQEPNQSGAGPDGSSDAGLADLIIGQIANEQQDIITDPLLNAWQRHDEAAGKAGSGEEVTDLCRDFFAPALGGASGVETEQEKAHKRLEEAEFVKKLMEGGETEAEAEQEAKKLVKPSHHGEEDTGAGTLYNEELGSGHYYLNDAFNLAAVKVAYPGVPCLKGVSLEPSFTAPTNVNVGEIVGFDGMESNITLDEGTAYSGGKTGALYPTYEWNFGDGTTVEGFAPGAPSTNSPEAKLCELPWLSPCAGSAFHTYTYGGTYRVTLTVTDVGGNAASVTELVKVDGPAPPSSEGEGSGHPLGIVGSTGTTGSTGSSGGAKSGGSPKGGKGSESKTPLSRPVATAIVATTSLTKAIETGLQVRYSVNQQVAGHFEVLIPTTLAKRLKIKGEAAKDLPAGATPQTLIAYALLITTRSAHGTISIEIPKSTGVRLARLHHVKLTLRLQVRNASRTAPKKTLLQTAVKLHR